MRKLLILTALVLSGCLNSEDVEPERPRYEIEPRQTVQAAPKILPGIPAENEQEQIARQRERMKQIVLACHAYHNESHCFPSPVFTATRETREPLLSWRVALLPFLGQQDLYAKFHLDEPWNSPRNIELLDQMPEVYRIEGSPSQDRTSIQLLTGPATPFPHTPQSSQVLSTHENYLILRGPKFSEMTDGGTHTILLVEASADRLTPWTKPDDQEFDTDFPEHVSLRMRSGGFLAAMFDSTVLHLRATISPWELARLISPRGNEDIALENLLVGTQPDPQLPAPPPGPKMPEFIPGLELGQSRAPQQNSEQISKLRNLAEAMIQYQQSNGVMPAPVWSQAEDGKPLLSWRVALLPWLGYEELFARFRHDEPWDSPHNLPLLDEMPDVYRSAGLKGGNLTSILVLTGPETLFPESREATFETTIRKGRALRDLTDGPERTILCIEAGANKAVPWTKPEDLDFNPASGLPLWGQPWGSRFLAAMVNTTVLPIEPELKPSVLAMLTNPADGHFPHPRDFLPDPERSELLDLIRHDRETKAEIILRALTAHMQQRGSYPPPIAYRSPSGQPLLSWRVAILPFMGEQELFAKFRLDEPWDSEHNLALATEMPAVFAPARQEAGLATPYQYLTGPATAFPRSGPATQGTGVAGPNWNDFPDGSQTILFVETGADKLVPWTRPEDVPARPDNPLAPLGTLPEDGFWIGTLDRIWKLPRNYPAQNFNALTTPGGGEKPNLTEEE